MSESPTPRLELVVPVYNEQETIEVSIRALHASLGELFPDDAWIITIADNASTDATPALADYLAERLDGVHVLHLSEKGRGRALKQAWLASEARSPVTPISDTPYTNPRDRSQIAVRRSGGVVGAARRMVSTPAASGYPTFRCW